MGNRSARRLLRAQGPLDGDGATFAAAFSDEAECISAIEWEAGVAIERFVVG